MDDRCAMELDDIRQESWAKLLSAARWVQLWR